MSNYKTVFFTLGILQVILGLAMIIPIIIQFIYNELDSSFISSGIITIIFGILFFLSNLDHDKKLNLPQAFLLTALSWLSIAVFGSLPFIFSNLELNITDAFFESMSGITTTGSTIITNLNVAPKSILLWRAILQWLGGIGIIVMAITLMPIMNVGGMQLFKISSNDTAEKILPKSKEISLRLIFIYSILTFSCAFFYKIFGMNFFDSLTHSMTTIATGGFSNYNQSIGYFDSILIETTAMIFILLGSLPFIAYLKFLNGNKKIFFSDTQIKTFFKVVFFSIIILFIYLLILNQSLLEISIRSVAFNVISILTGTGYVTKDFNQWGDFPLIFFLILMFIGGCAGSTACGIKIFRIQLLYHFLTNQLKKIIYPRGVFVIKYDKNNIDDKFMSSVISFIFLYIVIFFLLTAILSLTGLDFITSISGAATSISNVGPGLGETIGPNGNFSSLSNSSKWALSLGMILGRLELFAILVLFIPSFWRKF
jgi:trk system potassium uptake protein TrkH